MKKLLLFILIITCPNISFGQGVGIDIVTPTSKLDVGGNVRVRSLPDSSANFYVKADDFGNLFRDSVKTSSYIVPIIRPYITNSTWTKPANLAYVIVEVVGGGGGGGNTAGAEGVAGGGGGGYSRKVIEEFNLGISEVVVVGAGGVPQGSGGTSSFGVHLQATGGSGGFFDNPYFGGVGGVGSLGDFNSRGNDGGTGSGGTSSNSFGGNGGGSYFGGGGYGGSGNNSNGKNGNSHGGGGGGASDQSSGTQSGGSGASGVVIVTEYFKN